MRPGFFMFFLLSSLTLLPTQLFAYVAPYLMLWKPAELEGWDCPYYTCSEQLARSKSMQPTAGWQGAGLLRRAGKAIDPEVRQRLAMTFLIF